MKTYNSNEHPLITLVTSSSNTLGKKFPKDKSYQPGVLLQGMFAVLYIISMAHFYEVIKQLTQYQVLLLGIPKNGSFQGNIASKKYKKNQNDITRTKSDIGWNPYGISYLLIDIDFGDIPGFVLNTAKEVLDFLISLDPELARCGILILPSSSQKFNPSKKSWHCYLKVCNASDVTIKRYSETLQSVCWLRNLGAIKLSKSGAMLVRQVFDMAVFSPERLIVESCFSDDTRVVFKEIEPLIQEGKMRVLYE